MLCVCHRALEHRDTLDKLSSLGSSQPGEEVRQGERQIVCTVMGGQGDMVDTQSGSPQAASVHTPASPLIGACILMVKSGVMIVLTSRDCVRIKQINSCKEYSLAPSKHSVNNSHHYT